jgi:hypothetical protein
VDPAWSIAARGTGVSARSLNLQPGDADLKADGSTHHLNLQALAWTSSQGKLTASGQWKQGTGSQLIFQCEQLSLAPFVPLSRVNFLKELSVDVSGQAQLPGDPWKRFLWDQATLTVEGRFARAGTDVGQFRLAAADAVVTLNEVRLDVPEAQAEGQGTLQIGPRGDLRSIRAEASIRTDASLVADVLQAWDIGEGDENGKAIKLGMSGMADAQGAMEWSPETGMVLHGHVEVEEPRWHGATLDQLRADVAIEDDELRVDNIEGKKNDGEAHGALWLTWRDVAADQDEIDMRFEASGLSVEEGLRAGDVGDLPITGTGSGWARIHGRYDRIWIEGGGAVEGADVYGVKIPYASGDMVYDITGDQLSIKNVRVAEKAGALGTPEGEPTGLLALQGGMDMDLREETWQLWAKGNLDSQPLGLPGPRFQAQVDAQFNGPWTGSYGPFDLPLGTFVFQGGRLFLGQESLEGLEGKLDTGVNVLKMQVGQAGKDLPMVNLEAGPKGQALAGNLAVHIGADSADTAQLARRFTNGLLKNAGLDLKVEGSWDGSGLRWQGHLDHLAAHFEGFDLIQTEPTRLQGDETSLTLDVKMQGIGTTSTERAAWMHLAGRLPFSGTSPMDAKLRGTTDLAHLKDIIDHVLEVDEFSLMDDLKPEGTADFDLAFGGTFLEPKVDGLLSIKDGRTQIRTYPQSVEDLAFNLHFKGQDIILLESDPLRGRLAQGDLQAWGVISWEFGGITAYDLQTKLKNFQMRDIPVGFELYGDLDAVLQGTKEEGGILSGTLQGRRMLYQAEINLRDLILASATGGVPVLAASDPNDPLTRIDLDLDLVLHQPWEFDTNLLKVQGRPQGAFKIQGTLAEPGLKGKMNIVPGGRLTNLLPAGDVVLEYGTIEWTSPQVLYPNLDLQGRVDIPPYVVNLSIRGSMDGLEMKQTSTPALRQDEITAILIDPSLASEIGSFSGPGSQTSMNYGFANTGSGLVTTLALASFQESVRRTFGLDRVSVAWRTGSGTGTSETSVTVGKSANVFGYTIPLVLTHQQTGETTSTSGQVEWRFGNLVLLLGVSQSGANEAAPSGEIRHSWSPGW